MQSDEEAVKEFLDLVDQVNKGIKALAERDIQVSFDTPVEYWIILDRYPTVYLEAEIKKVLH